MAFNSKHPYFEGISQDTRNALKEYGGYGEEFVKQDFNFKTNTYTVSHKKHGKSELKDNLEAALFLNKEKISVVLLPVEDNTELLKIIPKNQHKEGKFADAWLPDLGVVIDFKRNRAATMSAIKHEIRDGKDQSDYILIDCNIWKGNLINLKRAIKGQTAVSKNIVTIYLLAKLEKNN